MASFHAECVDQNRRKTTILLGCALVALALLASQLFAVSFTSASALSVNSDSPRLLPFSHPSNRTLTSPKAGYDGNFGQSVATNGNTVVVGAPYENASGYYEAGHAYIFNAKTGKLIRALTSPEVQAYGFFGFSVAISGGTIVVGAPYETASGQEYAGHAYVFNAANGKSISNLTSPNPQFGGFFGHSVSVTSGIALVGAPDENASGYGSAGHAYAFNVLSGKLTQTLTSPSPASDGYFGQSVSISGNLAVAGAPGQRRAYAFNASSGELVSTLESPNSGGGFGDSVGASGGIVVVGAPGETAGGHIYAGNAYVFSAETGKIISNLTSPNPQALGFFGYSVAISHKVVVVGAEYETADGESAAGHAYTFNAETGGFLGTYVSLNVQSNGRFGYSVSISRGTIVVGAPFETAKGQKDAGHAYIF